MILRSVTKHVCEQNWFAVGIDFVIVVVGVFIGIQVANWNEFRVERELEQRYLERLALAVASDIDEYDDAVELARERQSSAQHLLSVLDGDPADGLQPSWLFQAIEVAGYTYHPDIADAVFQEMIATGNARIIRDEALRDQIAAYYGRIENRSQWRYIREHIQLRYMDAKAGLLTADQARRIATQRATAEFSADESAELIERIRAASAFQEWIPYAESWQIQQAEDYSELGDTARALKQRIEEALQTETEA